MLSERKKQEQHISHTGHLHINLHNGMFTHAAILSLQVSSVGRSFLTLMVIRWQSDLIIYSFIFWKSVHFTAIQNTESNSLTMRRINFGLFPCIFDIVHVHRESVNAEISHIYTWLQYQAWFNMCSIVLRISRIHNRFAMIFQLLNTIFH